MKNLNLLILAFACVFCAGPIHADNGISEPELERQHKLNQFRSLNQGQAMELRSILSSIENRVTAAYDSIQTTDHLAARDGMLNPLRSSLITLSRSEYRLRQDYEEYLSTQSFIEQSNEAYGASMLEIKSALDLDSNCREAALILIFRGTAPLDVSDRRALFKMAASMVSGCSKIGEKLWREIDKKNTSHRNKKVSETKR